MSRNPTIDTSVLPFGDGCVECLAAGGWWYHLRRCALCGHVGCCDSSPSRHATAHFQRSGHPVMQSYEPREDWFWNYDLAEQVDGPPLARPHSHPQAQPTPGPAGAVPGNWMDLVG